MKNPQLIFVSDKEEQDTSVTDRYSNYCKGWNVYNQNTNQWMKDRKVITTRSDGRILIEAKIVSNETQVGVYTL